MEDGQYVPGSVWFYAPNKIAPPIFTVLFLVSGTVHLYQCARYKSWKTTGILPWSAVLFFIGFLLRIFGSFNIESLAYYIESVIFVYLAPPLFELANYFILSRCLYYIPYHSPIHPGRVFTTFSSISGVVEVLNAAGASLALNPKYSQDTQVTGRALIKAALVLQLVVPGLFILLAVTFQRKCQRAGLFPKNVQAVLVTLYISTFLIVCRTIYRVVEYFSIASILTANSNLTISDISPILRYEWFFYVFEAMLMATNTILLNVRHPMRFLPKKINIYLAEDGVTEIEGPGYMVKRNFWMTLVDPFDVQAMIKGAKKQDNFWEAHPEGRVVQVETPGTSDEVALKDRTDATVDVPTKDRAQETV